MKVKEKYHATSSLPHHITPAVAKKNRQIHLQNRALTSFEDLLKIKKEKGIKEDALTPLFFNIGMAISLLMVIVAINWKVYDDGSMVDLGQLETDVNEIIDIPISKQPPPPPPTHEVFTITEVKNTEVVEELEIALDVDITADEEVAEIEFTAPIEEEEKVEEVFVIVEQQPMPKGGIDAFYEYVAKELRYPASAIRLGVSGTVYVQFVIEKDGTITQVEVVKGIGSGCDEEAIRVLENAPNWIPGKQRGVPVRVRKIIPIKFVIEKM